MKAFLFFNKWIRDDRASTSVEFSMVGIGFIFLMIGVLEFGRFAWISNVIDYAVDDAARYAVLHQSASSSEVEDYAKNMLDSFFVPPASLSLDIVNTNSSGVDFIEITGSYNYTSLSQHLLPESLSAITLDVSSRRPIYIYEDGSEGGGG